MNGEMVSGAPRRALLAKLRHIGDALLGTVVASALKAWAPGCRVTYLVPAGTEDLLVLCPDVDVVLTVERRASQGGVVEYLAGQWDLLRTLRQGDYDLALDLGGGDRSAFLTWWSGAPTRVGTAPAHERGRLRTRLYTRVVIRDVFAHTIQQDLEVLRAAGAPADTASLRLCIPEGLAHQAALRLGAAGIDPTRPMVLVHPTSRWTFKVWPEGKVAACVRRLCAERVQVVLTSGPDDEERRRLARIVEQVAAPVAKFPGTLALSELAAVLASARAFLGVDSAPAHLAAALGIPSVVLFGPTGAFNWGPWVSTPAGTPYPGRAGSQAAGSHLVIQRDWLCVPCGMAGCLFSKRSDCLEAIEVDEVFGAVMGCLSQRAPAGATR